MAIPKSYLTSFKNLKAIFTAMQSGQAPSKFTSQFLYALGFKSVPDRLVIGVLKALGFLNAEGTPTQRYFNFLDQTQGARVLAEAIREAYADLFQLNTKAYGLSQTEIKNKLKTLTQGQASDAVLDKMAGTFKALCVIADFSAAPQKSLTPENGIEPGTEQGEEDTASKPLIRQQLNGRATAGLQLSGLVYNIQLVLPESRDAAVYDAFFRSLKEHLL